MQGLQPQRTFPCHVCLQHLQNKDRRVLYQGMQLHSKKALDKILASCGCHHQLTSILYTL